MSPILCTVPVPQGHPTKHSTFVLLCPSWHWLLLLEDLSVPESVLSIWQWICYRDSPVVLAWPSLPWELFGFVCSAQSQSINLLSRDISGKCSWLILNTKISFGVFFFTINIFREIINEACELALGEQCGSRMVKVDSSWKKTQKKAVVVFQIYFSHFT